MQILIYLYFFLLYYFTYFYMVVMKLFNPSPQN